MVKRETKHSKSSALKPSLREKPIEEPDMGDHLSDFKLYKVAVLMGCVVFIVYFCTTYPSIPGGDSGELLSAACEGGVAHPPGYPLWTMLSSLFIHISPASPAYSVNILTCLCSSITSSVLFLVFYRFSTSWTISMICTFLFSFAPLMWTWSITGEVFALNNLLNAVIILVLVEFELAENKTRRLKAVQLGAFISGLALTNQHTVVLFLPAIICRVAYRIHQLNELNVKVIFSVLALACVGLSPYSYLVVSSYRNIARWSWGDQTTLFGFFKHLRREEYGTFKLGSQDGQGLGFVSNLMECKRSLIYQLTLPGYSLACIGIVQTFIESNKNLRRAAQTIFAMMICYISFFCWRANIDISKPLMREVVERFWLQPNIVWVILVALGAKLLYIQLNLRSFTPMVTKISTVLLVLVLCLSRGWNLCNHSNDVTVRDFADTIITSLPNNSLVLTKGDLPSGSLRYLQFCEGRRADITLIEQELMTYEWYIPKMRHLLPSVKFPGDRWYNVVGKTTAGIQTFNMLLFLNSNTDKRPVFVCIGMQEQENSWQSKYKLLPYGACHQVVSEHSQWVESWHPYKDTWTTSYHRFPQGSWEDVANEEMWNAKISKAMFLYQLASESQNPEHQANMYKESYVAYSHVMNTHQEVPAYFHKNYALVCEKVARTSKGEKVKALLADTVKHFELYIPLGGDDPQIEAIQDAVKSIRAQLA